MASACEPLPGDNDTSGVTALLSTDVDSHATSLDTDGSHMVNFDIDFMVMSAE